MFCSGVTTMMTPSPVKTVAVAASYVALLMKAFDLHDRDWLEKVQDTTPVYQRLKPKQINH